MEFKVISSRDANGLTSLVTKAISEGWKPRGSHQVVETHRQNRYSGTQPMDTIVTVEYSQTLIKD
jgi:hypothetical protein